MPIDLVPFINPSTTAVIALEVQENLLLPEKAIIPGVAAHAQSIGLIDRLSGVLTSARRVGTQVVYVSDERREDGIGGAQNLMVSRSITDNSLPSHGPIVAELTPQPQDISIEREHGMTGFFSTPLDAYLRNLGVTTVILTGVSANIAVNGTSIEAMNRGYKVIVLKDCVAGDPPEYVEALLRFTIRNVGLISAADVVTDHWASLPAV